MVARRTVLVVALLFAGTAASAQPAPRHVQVANPGALEFEVDPGLLDGPGTLWHLELLRASDAPATAQPVKAWDSRAVLTSGSLRVEFGDRLNGIPDGEYIATIRPAGAGGAVGVAGPFVLFGHAPTELAAQQSDQQRRADRHWTRVAIAIGAAIIVIPFLIR